MRSRARRHVAQVALLTLLVAASGSIAVAADDAITETEIRTAVEQLKADPNLATERTVRTLRWSRKENKQTANRLPRWLGWIGDLFSWLAETSRILIWLVAGVLAAMLVIWILRYLRERRPNFTPLSTIVPTHVRELDIRPESLPGDIAAASRSLWHRNEHRAALALLYRGCLSRLVHTHEVAIRQSSTEGECAQLAAQRLDADRRQYVAQLIRTWQRAVYGGVEPHDGEFEQLCSGFAPALDARAVTHDSQPLASASA